MHHLSLRKETPHLLFGKEDFVENVFFSFFSPPYICWTQLLCVCECVWTHSRPLPFGTKSKGMAKFPLSEEVCCGS